MEIGVAVTAVMNPDRQGGPPKSPLGKVITWWDKFLEDADNNVPGTRTLLGKILVDTLSYVKAGYQTGSLPLVKTQFLFFKHKHLFSDAKL